VPASRSIASSRRGSSLRQPSRDWHRSDCAAGRREPVLSTGGMTTRLPLVVVATRSGRVPVTSRVSEIVANRAGRRHRSDPGTAGAVDVREDPGLLEVGAARDDVRLPVPVSPPAHDGVLPVSYPQPTGVVPVRHRGRRSAPAPSTERSLKPSPLKSAAALTRSDRPPSRHPRQTCRTRQGETGIEHQRVGRRARAGTLMPSPSRSPGPAKVRPRTASSSAW
jgi:hypothetical protein